MSEMIERIAAALQGRFRLVVAEAAGMPFGATKVEMPGDHVWKGYAVAALEAMREPTKKMLSAGDVAQEHDEHSSAAQWTAMIEAALADT